MCGYFELIRCEVSTQDYSMNDVKDFETRQSDFLKEYGELREKYQLDFMSQPMFLQQENGTWGLVIQPVIVDLTKALIKSPFSV